jgi:2-oxo-4-hydroxy-4-carboxy-5-ureidoimidazoline decarboxylase
MSSSTGTFFLETRRQAEILPCCGSRAWAQVLAGERPFQEVLRCSRRPMNLERPEPRRLVGGVCEPPANRNRQCGKILCAVAGVVGSRQSGDLTAADSSSWRAEANREYESKFRRIFITCATGKSAAEILENLQRRLNNEEPAEILEAAEQQRQITQLRLRKWLGE